MTDKTEEKILDAALKIFAKKGYDAATTRGIADESGFTEMTLFRRFETKKNLFDQIMIQRIKKLQEDASTDLFIDGEFENSREFLATFIKNLVNFLQEHFETFHLSVTEDIKIDESTTQSLFVDSVTDYIKKNVPNRKIDYRTLGISVVAFVYVLSNEKYHGRTADFANEEVTIENYIDILDCILK